MCIQVAFIADNHCNLVALEAVLRELEETAGDQLLCLADVAKGGPRPARTLERLRRFDGPVGMGTADRWLEDWKIENV